jgi:hypothetical protein
MDLGPGVSRRGSSDDPHYTATGVCEETTKKEKGVVMDFKKEAEKVAEECGDWGIEYCYISEDASEIIEKALHAAYKAGWMNAVKQAKWEPDSENGAEK